MPWAAKIDLQRPERFSEHQGGPLLLRPGFCEVCGKKTPSRWLVCTRTRACKNAGARRGCGRRASDAIIRRRRRDSERRRRIKQKIVNGHRRPRGKYCFCKVCSTPLGWKPASQVRAAGHYCKRHKHIRGAKWSHCHICGEPTGSQCGVCVGRAKEGSPECKREYERLYSLKRGIRPRRRSACSNCGKPTYSSVGICSRVPCQGLQARANYHRGLLRRGIAIFAWSSCELCGRPTNSRYRVCTRPYAPYYCKNEHMRRLNRHRRQERYEHNEQRKAI